MNQPFEFDDVAVGSGCCAVIPEEQRRDWVAEVMYGVAAVSVALFLLATAF